jgi:signal transduction histidine kinase
VGRWLNGELLASGELAESLAGLDGLPLRLPTLRAHLTGTTVEQPLDPGWSLLRSAGRWAAEPFALADRPWWQPASTAREDEARNALWRHSVAHALAVRFSAGDLHEPDRRRLEDAALLQRLDLWALAVVAPDKLVDWLDAPDSTDRARLELRWFGAPGQSIALKLARGWRTDPFLIELLSPGEPVPLWYELWRASAGLATASRWGLAGEAVESPAGNEAARLRLDVSVQSACSGGLSGPSASPELEEATRSHARTRVELDLARSSLRELALIPRERPTPDAAPADRVGLEQLAEFAAGAAHEINNPLAVVVGRAQLLMARATDPDVRRSLMAILQQARRAHQILRDLIYIARPPVSRVRPCSPDGILRAAVSELQAEAAERGLSLSLRFDLPGGSRLVDPNGLRHLADVLLRNALEASPSGGRIACRSRASATGITWRFDTPDARLTEAQATHLFDPFFCGREAGRGLGLGLPRAARWVESVGGTLRVRRDRDGGTSFGVYLPDNAA